MTRLILLTILFFSSLLVIFRAPTHFLWYLSILVTEFSFIFISIVILLLSWRFGHPKFYLINSILGTVTLIILLLPYVQAWQVGRKLVHDFNPSDGKSKMVGKEFPFSPLRIFGGVFKHPITYQTFSYDTLHGLNLHFYPAQRSGNKPCIIVIHGGSWAAGDNHQLPELNSEMAKWGYHVASITYRLAPHNKYPAPVEDVHSAIQFLKNKAKDLQIDSSRFVLLGRSAGGQVALSAAYREPEKSIKGVIDFYGPTDMIWGYENPTNPFVLNSRKIMEDYLGGTLSGVPDQYDQSSATETVTSASPPTLMIYGENDPLVSPRHGTRLSLKLMAKGIPHYELYLPWATHGFDYTLHGPGGQLSTWTIKRFLEKILKDEK